MRKENLCTIGVILFMTSLFGSPTRAQGWKEIVPLMSNCEDVKRILGAADCKFPVMWLDSPKYDVTIHFAKDGDGWNVSKDTVVDVVVIFNDLLRLRDYETDFKDYSIKREYDVDNIMIYTNDKKGIKLNVQTAVADEPYISSIFFYPSEENKKKFKCKP